MACAQKLASSCYQLIRPYSAVPRLQTVQPVTCHALLGILSQYVFRCINVSDLFHFIGCTEAAVGGSLTDIAAAQGTLTDLHIEAETGNGVTEMAEIGIEADLETDDFLRSLLFNNMSLFCLVYSLVHTHMNSEYALLLVYRCEYIIEHDESCSTAL